MFNKMSLYRVKKGFVYLRYFGPKEFLIRLKERIRIQKIDYEKWYENHRRTEEELESQRQEAFAYAPLISIVVPVYQAPEEFLRQMILSVCRQTYKNWELCMTVSDEERHRMEEILEEDEFKEKAIHLIGISENRGISENTNAAIKEATGTYIGFLDQDDLLAPDALYEMVKKLNEYPEVGLLYSDEDKVTADLKKHFQPHFKPDFNLDLLRANNYICHFFVARQSVIRKAGGFRQEFDGAQDHDFIFRCVEEAGKIGHVPEILYHWRTHKASTADNPASKMYAFEAGRRAIEAHLKRTGTEGTVTHTPDLGFFRVQYPVHGEPLVSIIIPNKDEKEALHACIASIKEKTKYQNYEIIIVENNSTSQEIFAYYEELKKDPKIRVIRWEKEFNYSAINNYGARYANGEYLLFLNNDVTVITEGWLTEMLGMCQRREVGAVGVKLLYPDDTIQHAGCVIGIGGIAGHMFVNMPANRTGYLHKASILQDMSAVTAACMMMKKAAFEEVGGFTEELSVAFNDVDLCLKVRETGRLIVYDPYVQLYHMESKTRGAEDSQEKVRRFQEEIEYIRCHWIDILKKGDPYYNKNLSLSKWNYSLRPLKGMELKEKENR